MSDQEIKSIAASFMNNAAKLNKWCTGRKCDTCILYYNCPNLGLGRVGNRQKSIALEERFIGC